MDQNLASTPATETKARVVTGSKSLVSRADVAASAGVHPDTVRNWEKRGLLNPLRVGERLVRFDAAEVEAFLSKPA